MEDPLLDKPRELETVVGGSEVIGAENGRATGTPQHNHNIPSKLRLTVLNAAIGAFCFGYNTASIAGAELYLDKDAEFWNSESLPSSKGGGYLTDWKKGILVSCILLSGCVGALAASPVYNKIGSRGAHTLQNVFFFFGPIIMACANSFWVLVAARVFTGFGVGINSSICNLYISEISPAFCRGQLGGYGAFSVTAGILFAYIFSSITGAQIGSAHVWRVMLGIGSAPALIQIILSFCFGYLPESPRWLKAKGRFEEASISLNALGLQSCQQTLHLEPKGEQLQPTTDVPSICDRNIRQALIAGVGINVLQQVCGINVVIYFGPQILKNAGFQDVASISLSAGVSIAQLAAILVLMRLVDRVGRKPLAMIGIALMILGLAIIAVAFYVISGHTSRSMFAPWLAVLGMLLFRIAFSLSLGPMPYIVTSELFSNAFRTKGVAISWAANWISNFGVTLSFPILKDFFASIAGDSAELGSVCLFGLYTLMSFFSAIFIWKCVPETAGKDLGDSGS